jgi:tetratricopeptide (TPR) repeat protein
MSLISNNSDTSQRQFAIMAGLQRALALCKSGDMAGGLAACREVLALEPDNKDALMVGAGACVSLGDSESAADMFAQLQSIDPSNAKVQFHYGGVLRSLDRHEDALTAFRSAAALDPNLADAHNNIGGILQAQGDEAAALSAFEAALGIQSGDAGAHYFMGNRLLEMGRTEPAVDAFKQALGLNADFAPAHSGLANALLYAGEPAAALDSCEQCLAIDPMNRNAISYKSIALTELGQHDAQYHLTDFDLLVRAAHISPPPGYRDLAEFNRAIADYIARDPKLGQDRDKVVREGSELSHLLTNPQGPIKELTAIIQAQGAAYLAAIPKGTNHPFLSHPPRGWRLDGWGTILEQRGHQLAHNHANAWLSGVYYVQVPRSIRDGENAPAGWIEFGRPPDAYPGTRDPKLTLVQPEEGKMLLFPSYMWHRTFPFEEDARRITIAIDFEPQSGPTL